MVGEWLTNACTMIAPQVGNVRVFSGRIVSLAVRVLACRAEDGHRVRGQCETLGAYINACV